MKNRSAKKHTSFWRNLLVFLTILTVTASTAAQTAVSARAQASTEEIAAEQEPDTDNSEEQEEPKYAKGTLKAGGEKDATFSAEAEVGESAYLPENVKFTAREITKESDYKNYKDKLTSLLEDQGYPESDYSADGARFFDIGFTADDDEVEPYDKVKVTVKFDPAVDVTDADNLKVFHIDDKDDDYTWILDEKNDSLKTKVEDGQLKEISFESDRFSVYGVAEVGEKVSAAKAAVSASEDEYDYTVKVGETVSISGSGSYHHSWTSSDTSVATVDSSGKVTGVKVGTVTITHTWNTKKNGKGNTETESWTVQVTGEDETEISSNTGSENLPTVTVKGNKKAIDGLTVNVEEATDSEKSSSDYYKQFVEDLGENIEDKDNPFSFLHFYHIYLTDKNGNEAEPDGKANLQVTLSYNEEPSWWNDAVENGVFVGHYGDVDGSIENKGLTDESGSSSFTVKKVNVKKNQYSITFHLKSFSEVAVGGVKKAAAASTADYTVEVGKTVSIKPTDLKSSYKNHTYEWNVSDGDSYLSIESGASSETVIVKGLAVGTATLTLTHTNYQNRNNTTTETKRYTVQVTSGETITDADATVQSSTGNPVVSVKDTGNLKKLSGYHVVVKDVDPEYSSDKNFLKAYDIYLADDEGNKVSSSELMNGTLNLQVTLTYSTLPNWFDQVKTIKHFDNSTDRTEQWINNVKTNSTAKTISFQVHGFSDFELLSEDSSSSGDSGNTGGNTVKPSDISVWFDSLKISTSGDNSWQVVSGGIGSSTSEKIVTSSDGTTQYRIIKSVVPTDTENEFYIYLDVEPVYYHDWSQIFPASGVLIFNNNNEIDNLNSTSFGPTSNVNEVVKALGYSGSHYSLLVPSSRQIDSTVADHTKKTKEVKVLRVYTDSTHYVDYSVSMHYAVPQNSSNSFTIVYCAPNGDHCVKMSNVSYDDNTEVFTLPAEAYQEMIDANKDNYDNLVQRTDLNGAVITDPMGDYIEYLDSAQTSSGSISFNNSSNTLTWTLGTANESSKSFEKLNPDDDKSDEFLLDAHELVYKVRLKTEASGFNSCANAMSTTSGKTVYPTNGTTSINAPGNLPDSTFNIPDVRGLLYDIQMKKTVKDSTIVLKDAKFGIYTDESCTKAVTDSNGNTIEVLTGEDGLAKFKNLQYGTYYIKEIDPPQGYELNNEVHPVTVCYTTNSSSLVVGNVSANALYKDGSDSFIKVEDEEKNVPLTGMVYGKDGRPVLLILLVLAAIVGGGIYYRNRRNRAD